MTEYEITIKPFTRYYDVKTGAEIGSDPIAVLEGLGAVEHIEVPVEPKKSTAEQLAEKWVASKKTPEDVKAKAKADAYKDVSERLPELYLDWRLNELGAEKVAELLHKGEFSGTADA